nr:hypothetical protein CPGR_00612 [Mycolicibacter nonchromogenicus]
MLAIATMPFSIFSAADGLTHHSEVSQFPA